MLFIEITLRTLPFTKVSLKSSGSSISEKIQKDLAYCAKLLLVLKKNLFLLYKNKFFLWKKWMGRNDSINIATTSGIIRMPSTIEYFLND